MERWSGEGDGGRQAAKEEERDEDGLTAAERAAKEEAERRRREGTPVTPETFAAWYERFQAERLLEKAKKATAAEAAAAAAGARSGRPTGRQIFESRGAAGAAAKKGADSGGGNDEDIEVSPHLPPSAHARHSGAARARALVILDLTPARRPPRALQRLTWTAMARPSISARWKSSTTTSSPPLRPRSSTLKMMRAEMLVARDRALELYSSDATEWLARSQARACGALAIITYIGVSHYKAPSRGWRGQSARSGYPPAHRRPGALRQPSSSPPPPSTTSTNPHSASTTSRASSTADASKE